MKRRTHEQVSPFQNLILLQTKLIERNSILEEENTSLSTLADNLKLENRQLEASIHSRAAVSQAADSVTVNELHQKLFRLQEELTEMHRLKIIGSVFLKPRFWGSSLNLISSNYVKQIMRFWNYFQKSSTKVNKNKYFLWGLFKIKINLKWLNYIKKLFQSIFQWYPILKKNNNLVRKLNLDGKEKMRSR